MEWVKSLTGYYRLIEIATGSDAMEVMFKRGDALAGEIEQGGFIPEAMLKDLTRRPTQAQAKKIADQLVKSGLWARVRGGYVIVDWAGINGELVKLQARKKRDRDRKRAERAASVDMSRDESVDSPAERPVDSLLDHKRESQRPNAAAAASSDLTVGGRDLPPAVAILRAALEAHKLTVQWSNLSADDLADIERLVSLHGDTALVKSAVRSFQPDRPPATAKAWLGQWRDLRAPGELAVVKSCPERGHSGTTTHCAQCASEQKAGTR